MTKLNFENTLLHLIDKCHEIESPMASLAKMRLDFLVSEIERVINGAPDANEMKCGVFLEGFLRAAIEAVNTANEPIVF